jgi:uncharacterized membrane protein
MVNKTSTYVKKIRSIISESIEIDAKKTDIQIDLPFLILLGSIAGYTILFSYVTLMRHWTYYSAYLDLGWFEQALWSVTQGHFFYISALGSSHFGSHNSPILFLLVPLYYLFPHTETLLIMQTILLALGAIPLYYIGRLFLDSWGGLVFSWAYLLYPGLHGVNLFDFHELAFLPLLLFCIIYFIITKQFYYFIGFSFIAMMIKEDVSILLFMLTSIAIIAKKYSNEREKLILYITLMIYVIWTLSSLFWIIPHFSLTGGYYHSARYDFSNGIIGLIANNFFLKLVYIFLLLLPLALIPLIAPEFLIVSIPSFAEILLQSNVAYRITTQYSTLVLPILFVSAIIGVRKIQTRYCISHNTNNPIYILILICSVFSCIFCTPAPISPFTQYYHYSPNSCNYTIDQHVLYLDQAISVIPVDSSITAQNNLAGHLSRRMNIFTEYHPNVDYIMIDNRTQNLSWLNSPIGSFPEEKYDTVFDKDGIQLYKRKETG